MAKLNWDVDGTRKFHAGVSHGVVYPKADGESYDNGAAWNGLTGVTESPSGAEPTDLWADNMKYARLISGEDYVGAEGFDDTVQGIRNAAAAGLIVSVNTPLCSLNRDYAETLRFVHGLGVRYVTCSGLIPTGSAAGEESRATRLSQEELTDILRQAAETAHGLGMELDFTSPGWLPEEALRDMGLHLIPSCGACLSNMALAPDGTVLPCQSWLEGPGLGNLLTDDWSGIWDGEPCRRIRAESAKMEHICQLRQEGGC